MAKAKTFSPKPGEPGASITWTQFAPDGSYLERTGTIVDRAPSVDGAQMVWWVMPSSMDERDLYPIIAVGKATRIHSANGRWACEGIVSKGAMFASWDPASPTGKQAAEAKPAK